jgi:colanic acid/amylovoran biosynthesis glycosyltransferase
MPVVSTFHCDIPEVVLDGETGLLWEEKNVEDLAAALMMLHNDRGRLLEMGRNGRERMTWEYNAKRQGERLDELYSDLRSAW